MSALSPILRKLSGHKVGFWCPGCNDCHAVNVWGDCRPKWGYNGNADAPSFTPSILITTGHYCQRSAAAGDCYCTWDRKDQDDFADMKCSICHSFVTDGRIQFLSDCTHELAGQTVPLPAWPEGMNDGG